MSLRNYNLYDWGKWIRKCTFEDQGRMCMSFSTKQLWAMFGWVKGLSRHYEPTIARWLDQLRMRWWRRTTQPQTIQLPDSSRGSYKYKYLQVHFLSTIDPAHGSIMSKSSLSSVVSNLVRASMGSSISDNVADEDLDRHVAELILKEAKQKGDRYNTDGIRAYLNNGM